MTSTTYTTIKDEWHQAWASERGFNAITVGAMVAGFVVFWPLGFAVLIRNIWREKQYRRANGEDYGCVSRRERRRQSYASSGNSAFDAYRNARLEELEAQRRKLEEEQRDFAHFMDELRNAKDREEFDRYMAQRNSTML